MAGSSWPLAVLGWKLALGFEFVAQVVQGVVLAVRLGAEGGPGRGDQVVQVGQGAGQAGAEPADLRVQQRNQCRVPWRACPWPRQRRRAGWPPPEDQRPCGSWVRS